MTLIPRCARSTRRLEPARGIKRWAFSSIASLLFSAAALGQAADAPPLGVAGWDGSGACVAWNAELPAMPFAVKIVSPSHLQVVAEGTVSARLADACSALARSGLPGPYYTLRVEKGQLAQDRYGIVFPSDAVQVTERDGALVLRRPERPEVMLRACTTPKELHLTAWAGTALQGPRVWHAFVPLGYSVEPSCMAQDTVLTVPMVAASAPQPAPKSPTARTTLSLTDWISLSSSIATFLGVIVALIAVWLQLRKMNQQLTIQHFSDYTKRYQEIILRFPEDINTPTFRVDGRPGYDGLMRNMRAYFDLSFEEWYLNRRGLIESLVWSVWESGMQSAMSKPAFQQAWAIVRRDTSFGDEFETYLDGLQARSEQQ